MGKDGAVGLYRTVRSAVSSLEKKGLVYGRESKQSVGGASDSAPPPELL